MKNLILENWGMQDIPKGLQRILETDFTENREYWTQFQKSWYPENREVTTQRFVDLETGDNIICETVFEDWQQLELISLLLMQSKIKEGLNIYIKISNGLQWQIQEYFDESHSDIEDNYYDKTPEQRMSFKNDMNKVVLGVLVKHNVYDLNRYEKTLLKTSDFNITD